MRLSRTGLLTWGLAASILLLRAPHAAATVADLASPSFPVVLVAAVELALLAVAAWAALALGACLPGGPLTRRARMLLPRALRGVLLAGVVTGLSVGAAHAGADTVPAPSSVAAELDGLALPDRPVSSASAAAPTTEHDDDPPTRAVRVRPGDTLWGIAATSLEPDADDADVAAAVRRWHEANRDVIGDDPDLLLPGQRLVAPEGVA